MAGDSPAGGGPGKGTAGPPGIGTAGQGETSKANRVSTGAAGTDQARTGGMPAPPNEAVTDGMPATPQAGTNGTRATRTPATMPAGPIGTRTAGRPTGSPASTRDPGPSALTVLAEAVRSPQRGGAGCRIRAMGS